MTSGFTQTFLVTPARQAVGLTSVALGIVRALQRLGVDVGFAKPVDQDVADYSDYFARTIFQLHVPRPLSLQKTAERLAAQQTAEVLEEIVALCMQAGRDSNLLVVEGLHTDSSHAFAAQLNVDIASSLKAGSSAGSVTNSGNLLAGAKLDLSAASLFDAASGEIAAGARDVAASANGIEQTSSAVATAAAQESEATQAMAAKKVMAFSGANSSAAIPTSDTI